MESIVSPTLMRFFLNVALVGVGLAGIPVAFAKANDFGGPESVGSRIANDLDQEALYPQPSPLQPYFDWKKSLEDRSGFSYSLSALLLYQGADSGEDAFGGVYRFSGSWNLFGGETGNPGRLEFRVENRSNLGGSKAPGDLGGAIGAAALNPGFGYSSNFDTDLAVFNWTQLFNNKRGGFAVGRLAFDAYLDPYAFQTFSRAFVNRGFVLNPTVATTGVGALGFVAKGFVTDNLWIGGQIHDANARSGEFDWDTINEGEFLYAGEIGWTPAFDRYKTDRVQLTYWFMDERSSAGIDSGYGFALTASRQCDRWLAFARWGHSDGGAGVAAENAFSAGFEYAVSEDQAFSLAGGWAEPSEKTHGSGLRDEYVLETSYRMQISPSVSLMPDLQVIFDPANNPEDDVAWVAGIRTRINF